jgi:hypothetical protein
VIEVRYIDSIDESDKNMLLWKEKKAKILNVEQQIYFSYTLEEKRKRSSCDCP